MIFLKKSKYLFLIVILLIIFLLSIFSYKHFNSTKTSGKNKSKNDNGSETLNIQTSIYPIQFFTEQIGAEFVNVQSIYPPNANDHTFEPTQKDIIKIAESDLFFYNGLELEGFINNAKSTLKKEKVTFIPIGEHALEKELGKDYLSTLPEHSDDDDDHDHDSDDHTGHDHDADDHAEHDHDADDHAEHDHDVDPHIWLDPIFATAMAEEIKNILIEKLPDQANIFEHNFTNLKMQLEDIHEQLLEVSKNATRKEFLVTHASFGYWESRYDVTQISIKGLYSEDEVSTKKLTEIINLINEQNINHVLVEQNESTRYVNTLSNETNVTSLPIHNLSVLTDEDISNGDDFFSIMEKNIITFEKALS